MTFPLTQLPHISDRPGQLEALGKLHSELASPMPQEIAGGSRAARLWGALAGATTSKSLGELGQAELVEVVDFARDAVDALRNSHHREFKKNALSHLEQLTPYAMRGWRADTEALHRAAEESRVAAEQARKEAEEHRAHVDSMAKRESIRFQQAKFDSLSAGHRKASRVWLASCGFMVVVLALYLGSAILEWPARHVPPLPAASWHTAGNLPYFTVRAGLLSLVSTLIAVTLASFRAERHNELVNKHRAAALLTMEELKDKDGHVYEGAVVKATEAIFTPAATGYTSHTSGHPTLALSDLAKLAK